MPVRLCLRVFANAGARGLRVAVRLGPVQRAHQGVLHLQRATGEAIWKAVDMNRAYNIRQRVSSGRGGFIQAGRLCIFGQRQCSTICLADACKTVHLVDLAWARGNW